MLRCEEEQVLLVAFASFLPLSGHNTRKNNGESFVHLARIAGTAELTARGTRTPSPHWTAVMGQSSDEQVGWLDRLPLQQSACS